MDPKAWTEGDRDSGRRTRLALGYGAGALSMFGLLAFMRLAGSSSVPIVKSDDEVVDVQLAKSPEPEPEPEEEIDEEPEPGPRVAGPVLPRLVIPKEIPKEAPKETDAPAGETPGGGDPYANPGGGGGGKGTGKPKPPPPEPPKAAPAPAPKPEKKKVYRANEVAVQPVAQSRAYPSYPASARSAGVEGVVVVRYVITEAGTTAAVKAVRGPTELMAVCEAAVKSWTFSPAKNEAGVAIPVVKFARFPFKIKT